MIEVELRGPLDDKGYEDLKGYLEQHGERIAEDRRFMIAYDDNSGNDIKDCLRDIRLRVTNGAVEIIVKKGSTHVAQRQEESVFLREQDLGSAMRMMELLGYHRGIAAYRHIERYILDGIEFALQGIHRFDTVTPLSEETLHSRIFEAELQCAPGEEEAALARIKEVLAQKALEPFTREGWQDYMIVMNSEANMQFDVYQHGELFTAAVFAATPSRSE